LFYKFFAFLKLNSQIQKLRREFWNLFKNCVIAKQAFSSLLGIGEAIHNLITNLNNALLREQSSLAMTAI